MRLHRSNVGESILTLKCTEWREKGYKGGFAYFLFGLLFGVFAFFCVIGMPISREEQAERDLTLVKLIMKAQWVSAGQDNNENGRPNEDIPMGDTQAV